MRIEMKISDFFNTKRIMMFQLHCGLVQSNEISARWSSKSTICMYSRFSSFVSFSNAFYTSPSPINLIFFVWVWLWHEKAFTIRGFSDSSSEVISLIFYYSSSGTKSSLILIDKITESNVSYFCFIYSPNVNPSGLIGTAAPSWLLAFNGASYIPSILAG